VDGWRENVIGQTPRSLSLWHERKNNFRHSCEIRKDRDAGSPGGNQQRGGSAGADERNGFDQKLASMPTSSPLRADPLADVRVLEDVIRYEKTARIFKQ